MTIGKIGSLFISNADNAQGNRASTSGDKPKDQVSSKEGGRASEAVVVSSAIRDQAGLQTTQSEAQERAKFVNDIKERVDNRNYNPDTKRVAASILLELA
jgi:anti-sigma28 factor (negative regulator of flagellin synthesis)